MADFPKTNWIWIADVEETVKDEAKIVYFRKAFTMQNIPDKKIIKISADTRYKLYVNGEFAQFGPARGDHQIWYYDEIDISSYLREGENVIAVEVLRYSVAYAAGNFGMFRTTSPGLFVEETEEKENRILTDETWKCRVRNNYCVLREAEGFAPLMYLERCSGDIDTKDWKLPEYDDSSWENARAYNVLELKAASCPADLHKRPIPFMKLEKRRMDSVVPKYDFTEIEKWSQFIYGEHPVEIRPHSKVCVELNAGELVCGYPSMRLKKGAGSCIKMLFSEGYVQDGKSINGMGPKKGDRLDWVKGHLCGHTDTYYAAGYGNEKCEEIYEQYWFRTFRFIRLEIETGDEPCILVDFDYLKTGYPLEEKVYVETSDKSMKGIWDISLRSLKLCMHETYIDCPFYEQLQYAMDSRNEILYTYMISGDDRLARQCMDDFRRSQREDGMINCCHPNYGPNVIPGFAIYYILMVYDHMMYFGDKQLIKKHLPCIDGILTYFDEHLDERGIVGKTGGHISERYWSFIDWALLWGDSVGMPPAGYRGPITMESLLYIMGLQHAAKLCSYVGRQSTANEYLHRSELVQEAVNKYCRDEEGVYLDGPGVKEYSQHCQIFAVLTDTADEETGRMLLQKTLDEKEKYAQYTVATAFYLFRALEKNGMYDQTEKLWDTWKNMLKNHLTTCVENQTDERSDCHGWGALILYELPAVILGVRPGAPGFEKIKIAPVPGHLTWAKGSAATKWGSVYVEWKKRDDGTLDLRYQVPEIMKDKVEVSY